jgi:vacuolar-type H+-ATPase subunit D/Vma8
MVFILAIEEGKKIMWEVNFNMSKTLYEKTRKARATAGSCLVEDKKTMVLERLAKAVEKLKEARKEIRKAVQLALEMKEDGDDISNQVVSAVAEAFASYDNSWILREYIKDFA